MTSIAKSNVSSIAPSTASQLETKLRANETKQNLRALLRNIDLGKYPHILLKAVRQNGPSEGRRLLDYHGSSQHRSFSQAEGLSDQQVRD
jgi:hypothetical protein